ncbi:hypothetical protein [Streptomyces sp. NPDC058466]|uniref:hypothetical protein n=1 Tax=Streptomyces sp. NPDC058466 TaxID=3346512 RepID=UPI00365C61C7
MTITNLIPGLKGSGSRRAADKLAELRDENRKLLTRQMAADDYFALLMQDRDQVYAAWEYAEQARQEAEMVAACMQSERDEWRDEALALRAKFGPQLAAEANAQRVDVPPMVRDTSAIEDQATGPIYVKPLWEALNVRYVGPDAANPVHVPSWAAADEPEPAA